MWYKATWGESLNGHTTLYSILQALFCKENLQPTVIEDILFTNNYSWHFPEIHSFNPFRNNKS